MQLQTATLEDISAIIALAKTAWLDTYTSIITLEQIEFMLHLFYSEEVIASQMKNPLHHFIIAKEENVLKGYCHFMEEKGEVPYCKLSKLYLLPSEKGKGLGQLLMKAMDQKSLSMGISCIRLNVNRANSALYFYQKMGFAIIETVDIPLDKFWLNDYVMEKRLGI